MYCLRHSLRLLVLLLTLCLGVGGQLFGQYYPIHVTVQWPSSQNPENLLSATSSSEGRVATKQGLKVERVDKIGSFDASRLAHGIDTVRFEPSAQARYAFDSGTEPWYQRSVKLDEYYKPFAKGYIAPWKLIPTGEQDVVTARYEGKTTIDLSRVRFATSPNSPTLPAELHEESKTWSLKLPATDAQSSYDVFAIYEGEVLGKLRVVSYPKQRHKLTLVPVNDAQLDKDQIERELNSIYNSVGVHFDVEVDARMRGNYSWDRDGDGKLSVVGKSFFGRVREVKESAEMDYLKKAYTQLSGTLDGVYLFITDGAQGLDDKPQSLLGEMPRRSRFGYIFSGNSPNGGASALSHTIAHELGHGLFTLQHTFDDEYGGTKSQGQTRNLMDYVTGKELAAFQWNVLANPAVFTKFDRAEELALHSSKSCVVSISAELSQAIIQSGKALSMPSGKAFRLPAKAVIKELFYKDSSRYPASMGSVASFELNGVRYNTYYRVSDSQFAFYGANITRRFQIKASNLPVVHIQIDETTRKISIEGKAYPLAKEDFSCAEEAKRSIEAEHLEYTQAAKEDTTLGARDWERGLRVPARTLFTIGRVSQAHIDFSLQSLPKDSVPLSEQESIIQELTSQVSLFGRGKTFLGEVLEDKLETYQLRNSSRFVVVQAKVKTASLDQREWNRLALKVFERSGLGEKDILVTVPYVGLSSLGRSGRVLHMIGVATGSKVSVAFEKLRKDHEPAQEQALGRSIRDFVLDLFTHTAKRTTTYRGYFNASRCITILEDNHKGEAVPGYSYNVAVIPYIQQGVDGLVDIIKRYNDREDIRRTGQKSGVTPEGFSSSENERWLREHYAPALLALSEDADNLKSYKRHEVRTPIHYRERYLEADNGRNLKNYQAYLLQYAYEDVLEGLNASVRSGFTFKREHSFTDKTDWFLARYVDEAVYSTLDVASITLGLVGMDTAPDILNVFYSSLRGHYTNASLNAASLLFVGPVNVKTLKSSLERGRTLFKLVKGGKAAVPSIKTVSKTELTKFITSQVDQLLGKLKATKAISPNKEAELRKILSDFTPEVLEKLLHTEGVEIVLRDMAQNGKKLQGGKFQLQYFVDHFAEGTSIVKFEVREEIKVGEKTVARIYDIVTETERGPINYELKNWSGWQSWSSKAFRDQFLKDLATMAKGKRVKWVFSGHKMSREELKRVILASLQEPAFRQDLKKALPTKSQQEIVERLLGIEPDQKIDLIQALERDEVFDVVFEIIQ